MALFFVAFFLVAFFLVAFFLVAFFLVAFFFVAFFLVAFFLVAFFFVALFFVAFFLVAFLAGLFFAAVFRFLATARPPKGLAARSVSKASKVAFVPSSEPHPKLKPLPTLGSANGCFDNSIAHRLALCGYSKKQVKLVISSIFVLIDKNNATGYPQF